MSDIAVKDLSDREVLSFCWPWHGDEPLATIRDAGGAVEILQEHGWPYKIVLRKLEQLEDRGLIEYGVSICYPWRTPKGEAFFKELAA